METDPSWLVKLMLPGVVGSRKPSCVHLEKISLEDTTAAGGDDRFDCIRTVKARLEISRTI